MSDLISRQAAIDEANAWLLECLGVHKQDRSCGLIRRLEDLPAAQPDSLVRSSARWMSVAHKRARICSRCFRDEPYKFADHDADVYDFCPHCGAKMEVDDGSD